MPTIMYAHYKQYHTQCVNLLRREFGGGVNGESHLIPAGDPSTSVKESYHGREGLCSFLRLSMP